MSITRSHGMRDAQGIVDREQSSLAILSQRNGLRSTIAARLVPKAAETSSAYLGGTIESVAEAEPHRRAEIPAIVEVLALDPRRHARLANEAIRRGIGEIFGVQR